MKMTEMLFEFAIKFYWPKSYLNTFFKEHIPSSTSCQYSDEMSKKSEVVTMPIIMKDEKKIF